MCRIRAIAYSRLTSLTSSSVLTILDGGLDGGGGFVWPKVMGQGIRWKSSAISLKHSILNCSALTSAITTFIHCGNLPFGSDHSKMYRGITLSSNLIGPLTVGDLSSIARLVWPSARRVSSNFARHCASV